MTPPRYDRYRDHSGSEEGFVYISKMYYKSCHDSHFDTRLAPSFKKYFGH